MYHIANDKRALRSAKYIYEGLEKCLNKKSFDKITISDIHEESYVSRATFYRLFDNLRDVLVYRCDLIFDEIIEALWKLNEVTAKNIFIKYVELWMEYSDFLEKLINNGFINIIYEAHVKRMDIIKELLLPDIGINNSEKDYLLSILSGLMASSFRVWCQHERKESPQQLHKQIELCVDILNKMICS